MDDVDVSGEHFTVVVVVVDAVKAAEGPAGLPLNLLLVLFSVANQYQ